MLKRYTDPVFLTMWSDGNKFNTWLKVELAFLEARVHHADLTLEAFEAIKAHAKINVARIEELEREFDHDMIAFVVCVQESLDAAGVGQYRNEIHKRLTSYDTEDPALILLLQQSVSLILKQLGHLEATLQSKAEEHKWTLMIARTHGQDAEPTTFGHLLMVYRSAVQRSRDRLQDVLEEELNNGKMSGAIGNYPGLDPELERTALAILGLEPADAETQILQRDRHAALLSAIAIAGGTLEQMCRTFWEMMRSSTRELEEPRRAKQRGSSRMAYKKNPIMTERFLGLPRLLRAYSHVAMENIATPECRDISQSSVERHILPDATALLHHMASKLTTYVERLVVFPERMKKNLDAANGVWAGQPIRDELMECGVSYDDAYTYVQRLGFTAVQDNVPMLTLACTMPISESDSRTAEQVIGGTSLEAFFDPKVYIEKGIEHIFRR